MVHFSFCTHDSCCESMCDPVWLKRSKYLSLLSSTEQRASKDYSDKNITEGQLEFTRLRDCSSHGCSTKRTQNAELHFEHCRPLDSSWSHSFIDLSVRNFSSMDFIANDQAFNFYGQVEELFLGVEVTINRQPFISGSLISKPSSTLSKEEYGEKKRKKALSQQSNYFNNGL